MDTDQELYQQYLQRTSIVRGYEDAINNVLAKIPSASQQQRLTSHFHEITFVVGTLGSTRQTANTYSYEVEGVKACLMPVLTTDHGNILELGSSAVALTTLVDDEPTIFIMPRENPEADSDYEKVVVLDHEFTHVLQLLGTDCLDPDLDEAVNKAERALLEWEAYTNGGVLLRAIEGSVMDDYLLAHAVRLKGKEFYEHELEFDDFPADTIVAQYHKSPNESKALGATIAASIIELFLLQHVDPDQHKDYRAINGEQFVHRQVSY
jgi:hypothetical protein